MLCGGVGLRINREWNTAISAVAATAGVCFASGRRLAMFFSQMKGASWLGVLTASMLFGALCGWLADTAAQADSRGFSQTCRRVLRGKWRKAVLGLYGALMLLVSAVMLAETGKLAELTLPVRHAYWIGLLAAMAMACTLCILKARGWNAVTLALCGAFYAGLALDPRSVQIYGNYETELRLAGSVPAAVSLGALYAMLGASVAADRAASDGDVRPVKLAVCTGGLMLVLLTAANAALLKGGDRLLSQAFPMVVLAARWGKVGFYGCIAVKWMCAVATLSAALRALTEKCASARKRRQKAC